MQIRSLLQLKVLLLLHRHSSQWWSARDAAVAVHAGPEAVGRALEQLGGSNLLDVRIADRVLYRFSPTDRAVVSLIDEVSGAHERAPGRVEAAVAAGVQRVARRRTGRAR